MNEDNHKDEKNEDAKEELDDNSSSNENEKSFFPVCTAYNEESCDHVIIHCVIRPVKEKYQKKKNFYEY